MPQPVGLYVGVTRGRADNLILVDADRFDDVLDRLTTVIASDRVDVPATVQRRQLLEGQHSRRSDCERHPIPDWFAAIERRAAGERDDAFAVVAERLQEREAREALAAEARRQFPGAQRELRPFADRVQEAKLVVGQLEGVTRLARQGLDTARLGTRRRAREAIAEAERRLASAEFVLTERRADAQPFQQIVSKLQATIQDCDSFEGIRGKLDEWSPEFDRYRQAEQRVDALGTWRRWAAVGELDQVGVELLRNSVDIVGAPAADLFGAALLNDRPRTSPHVQSPSIEIDF
jgi:hypothetical protein